LQFDLCLIQVGLIFISIGTNMVIESFLTKIAAALFKQALIGAQIPILSKAIEIYSVFQNATGLVNQIKSINSSNSLQVFNFEVLSDKLATPTAEFLYKLGSETFAVEKTTSGVYIASNSQPVFRAPELNNLYDQVQFHQISSGGAFRKTSQGGAFKKQ
jgi:hypothetical protein